jgi:hypothetical protein
MSKKMGPLCYDNVTNRSYRAVLAAMPGRSRLRHATAHVSTGLLNAHNSRNCEPSTTRRERRIEQQAAPVVEGITHQPHQGERGGSPAAFAVAGSDPKVRATERS